MGSSGDRVDLGSRLLSAASASIPATKVTDVPARSNARVLRRASGSAPSRSPCHHGILSPRRPAAGRILCPRRHRPAPRQLQRAACCGPGRQTPAIVRSLSTCWSRLSRKTRVPLAQDDAALAPRSNRHDVAWRCALRALRCPVTMCPMFSYCGVVPGRGRAATVGATNGSR